ncbi:MAG TPA: class II aldolase/adducin family protein, partial [Thermopolyspora sp.]
MTNLLAEQRRAVVAACAGLVSSGLLRGTSGNVSVRDPSSGLIAMTPSAVPYGEMTAEHVAVVTAGGEVVEGSMRPTSEAALHLRVYGARPEVRAVVHTHSVFATTFAALR